MTLSMRPTNLRHVESPSPYEMTVELSVIESLGINLYSNAAAVLSELVANAYDADANYIDISWVTSNEDGPSGTVIVQDDGCGMTADELNSRFLKAGYKKRENEGTESPKWKRPFMGRKGIGKLSVFSLANVVQVYSMTENGTAVGLEIDLDELLKSIKKDNRYHPPALEVPKEYQRRGTTLVLKSLKSKRASITANALKKRVARRFAVTDGPPDGYFESNNAELRLAQETVPQGNFYIRINEEFVSYTDRQDLKSLQFIWEFGEEYLEDHQLPRGVKRFRIEDNVVDQNRDWRIKGWIGTSRKPNDLVQDKDAGSLQNVIVLARKRPIQDGIVQQLDYNGFFGNYVTGVIEADFLDQDDLDDIATSDRQRLIEDDERVTALVSFLRQIFVTVSEEWGNERRAPALQNTVEELPVVQEWLDNLPQYQQAAAQKMVATISTLEFGSGDATRQRNTLLKSGILAFQRIGLQESADALEQLSTVTAENLLPILGAQGDYEISLWGDILRTRVEAIAKLQDLTNANEKERVLQEHIFDKLWLLDPSWERATTDQYMEENLTKIVKGITPRDDNDEEITGRIDLRYRTISGRHVIVELKRYGVKTALEDLVEQGGKYRSALGSAMQQSGRDDDAKNIEVYFIVGDEPRCRGWSTHSAVSEKDYRASQLATIGGRVFYYDQLITQARNQYREYLDASAKAREIEGLFEALDGESQ